MWLAVSDENCRVPRAGFRKFPQARARTGTESLCADVHGGRVHVHACVRSSAEAAPVSSQTHSVHCGSEAAIGFATNSRDECTPDGCWLARFRWRIAYRRGIGGYFWCCCGRLQSLYAHHKYFFWKRLTCYSIGIKWELLHFAEQRTFTVWGERAKCLSSSHRAAPQRPPGAHTKSRWQIIAQWKVCSESCGEVPRAGWHTHSAGYRAHVPVAHVSATVQATGSRRESSPPRGGHTPTARAFCATIGETTSASNRHFLLLGWICTSNASQRSSSADSSPNFSGIIQFTKYTVYLSLIAKYWSYSPFIEYRIHWSSTVHLFIRVCSFSRVKAYNTSNNK